MSSQESPVQEAHERIRSVIGRDSVGTVEKKLELYIGITLIVIYSMLILINVTSRGIRGQQVAGVFELTKFLFIWMCWLAVAYGIRQDIHLRFTLFRANYTNRKNYAAYFVEWVGWLALSFIILWNSIPLIQARVAAGTTIIGTGIPTYFGYLAIPVGFTLIAIRVLQQAILVSHRFKVGEDITVSLEIGSGGSDDD
jgi:TRAP-type C4-dicarboxylate transport system permease small subunit